MITAEELHKAFPKGLANQINGQLVDKINSMFQSPEEMEAYRANLISASTVLQDGTVRLSTYLNAVKFVTHKMGGDTNIAAYIKTFPERYDAHVKKGTPEGTIASLVSTFANSKLVSGLLEQSIIPLRIYNQDKRQTAINTLNDIMTNPKASDKARVDAANVLLTHLADPQDKRVQVDVKHDLGANDIIAQLTHAMNAVAQQSRERVIEGTATSRQEANRVLLDKPLED